MRIFRENFIVGFLDKYMLINLISFRRKIISTNDYKMLQSINNKQFLNLTEDEINYYEKLITEKQLLSEELIHWYDEQRKKMFPCPINKIAAITINLSYDCNFKCKYCYQKDFNLNGEYLKNQDIDKIYDYICNYNALHNFNNDLEEVIISGGESLLERNINTINYICKKFSNCKLKLFTNGVNVLKYSSQIDFSKFHEIQVSFDGTDDVIHNLNMNSGNFFNKIIEGILMLNKLDIKLSIISMVTKESLLYIEKFLDLLKYYGITDLDNIKIRFAFAIDYNEPFTLKSEFYTPEEYIDMRQKVVKLIKEYRNITVDRLYDLAFLSTAINRQQNEQLIGRIAMCKTYKGLPLLFGPDHGIYWCTCTNLSSKLTSFDANPEELDKSPLLQQLMNRNIYQINKCKNCVYRYVCSSGCPLYALHSGKNANVSHCGIFSCPDFEKRAELYLGI